MNAKKEAGKVAADAKRPSAKRRPRRPSLSNEAFLARALDLFLEQGFERASIEAITAAAGIAKRTVYLRYGDKKSLFKAALQRAIEEWIVPVERLREVENGDLEASLLAIGQILVDNILSPAGLRLLRLTNAESGRMPEIGAYNVHQGTDPTIAYLADLLRRHIGQGGTGFPEAEDAAETFLHLVVGGPANAAAWGVVRDKAAIDRRIRYSVRIFLHGLRPASRESISADVSRTLEDENLRLKKLLAETMMQLDLAQERLVV
ncbi:MAG: TetR/AcrR family transcriptional regulator [Rhodospirillaceae bacterium]|nr:MAG: TetR/AcrR family transcriptional regulator [Rhodospirillaceae bacterium]